MVVSTMVSCILCLWPSVDYALNFLTGSYPTSTMSRIILLLKLYLKFVLMSTVSTLNPPCSHFQGDISLYATANVKDSAAAASCVAQNMKLLIMPLLANRYYWYVAQVF